MCSVTQAVMLAAKIVWEAQQTSAEWRIGVQVTFKKPTTVSCLTLVSIAII